MKDISAGSNPVPKFVLYFFGIPCSLPLLVQAFQNKNNFSQLVEPEGTKICRRNILVLSSIVILAGCMGNSPQDINFFGVNPSTENNIRVFSLFIFVVQTYWYVKRYLHLLDDGEIRLFPGKGGHVYTDENKLLKHELSKNILTSVPKRADLISNIVGHILTILSWIILCSWIA